MPKSREQRIVQTVDELVALGGWTTPDRLEKLGKKAKGQIKRALTDERKKQQLMQQKIDELSRQLDNLGLGTSAHTNL